MIKRYFLLIIGIISLALGIIGILLPLLPTTPFLLLAAGCFINSSPRLYSWLINNKVFGKYIINYREKRGIPLRVKVTSLSILWISISYSFFFIVESIYVRLILIAALAGVTVHLLRMKTLVEPDDSEKPALRNEDEELVVDENKEPIQ